MPQQAPQRYFRIAEANALVSTLEKQLKKLQAHLEEARARYREMEMIKAVGYREDGTLIMLYDYRQAKAAFEKSVSSANRLVEEIHGMGCQIKSIDMGLIDFPAVINGEEVLLCWRYGEPEVGHFHPLEGDYSRRRPLDPTCDDTPIPARFPPGDVPDESGSPPGGGSERHRA